MYRNTAILAVPAGGRPDRLGFCGQDDRKPSTGGTPMFRLAARRTTHDSGVVLFASFCSTVIIACLRVGWSFMLQFLEPNSLHLTAAERLNPATSY